MYTRRGKLLAAEREQSFAMREYLHDSLFKTLDVSYLVPIRLLVAYLVDDAHQNGIGIPLSVELHLFCWSRYAEIGRIYQLVRPKAQERRTQGHVAEGQEIDFTHRLDNFKLLGYMLRQPYYG